MLYLIVFRLMILQIECVYLQLKLSNTVTQLELQALKPHTEYTVTVYAMYGDEASDPMTTQETTCEFFP